MQIDHITIRNFRSLEDITIGFGDFYSAMSGKNNSGKTTVLKAIQLFFDQDSPYEIFDGDESQISVKAHYPHWKKKEEKKKPIEFELCLTIHRTKDTGLFKFIDTFVGLNCAAETFRLSLGLSFPADGAAEPVLSLLIDEKNIEDKFKAQEIHRRIKRSDICLFHNSTQSRHPYFIRHSPWATFGSIPLEEKAKINKAREALTKRLKNAATRQKEELTTLLGRLEEKYTVGISIPTLDVEDLPMILSLGDKKMDVPLQDWGSGTQNRTQILLALFKAKTIREAAQESDRITPILIIEEPESFLHPSAQAEFGRILRDLAREFEVQVIVTTHSPHMLSFGRPESNILLSRRVERGRLYETTVEKTSGEDWMRPFALALGVTDESFGPWRSILFNDSQELLLVEGEIDKAHMIKLRDAAHGHTALDIKGDVFAYGGDGFFAHDTLLRFILQRFNRVVVTFDLDVESKIIRKLESLSLKRNEDFVAIGLNQPGKKDIEGLLPSRITAAVAQKEPDLMNLAVSRDEGNNDARQKLKRMKFDEFWNTAKPGTEDFKELYRMTASINAAIRKQRKDG